ncbi:PH domain-containing protein [Hellea sp.]|nr:PH domain-containing protein [Hellea sp.]
MKVYKSKIDLWLMGLLVGSLTLPIILSLIFSEAFWFTFVICGSMLALTAWLYWATQYKVSATNISVHGGLFKINIPLDTIKSVKKTRNPMASPAFSLDRLEIAYGRNQKVLISPKDKTGFLSDIGWLEKISQPS